jgi:hypothetical protein
MMRLTTRPSEIVVMVVALALPFKAGGCAGRTACITVTASDLQGDGTCPDPATASMRLVNAPCEGSISSVDGPGALDDGLCCYPVTYLSGGGAVPCDLGPGFGGSTTGVGPLPGSSVSSGGPGGGPTTSTGTPGCVTCNEALNGAPFDQVCNDPALVDAGTNPATLLANLRVCACATACTTACDPTLCMGNAPDNTCTACLDGVVACAMELMTCQQN